MGFPTIYELDSDVRRAVRHYWDSRTGQRTIQLQGRVRDAGLRNEVTGGGHLDAFCSIFARLTCAAGYSAADVRIKSGLELPGYFRPTKKWDVVVHRKGRLVAVLEMKSQAGPSFGNNFNNRTEEAIGNAVDLRAAFRAGALGKHRPFLGYLFLLEHHAKSMTPVRVDSDIFPPLDKFAAASYARRYELLVEALVEQELYDAGALLLSARSAPDSYSEPNPHLTLRHLARAFFEHLCSCN
jgi:hypothetical protein